MLYFFHPDRLLTPDLVPIKNKVGWGLLEFAHLAQIMLLERCNLWRLLNPLKMEPHPQLLLFSMRISG